MKLDHIQKLLRAAKAKAQLDNAQLAAIRNFQAKLIAEADELAEKIKRPLVAEGADVSGADIRFAAKHVTFLGVCEAGRRRAATLVEPQRLDREAALKTSLREEIAWRRLAKDAEGLQQKQKEAQEEEKREAVSHRDWRPADRAG